MSISEMWSIGTVIFFTCLTLAINGPYLMRAVRLTFTPHWLSWLTIAGVTSAAAVVQVTNGGSLGSYALFVAGTMNLAIAIAGLRAWLNRRRDPALHEPMYMRPTDYASAVLAGITMGFYALNTDKPNVAIVLLGAAGFIGWSPTLRRALSAKYLEDLEPPVQYKRQTFRYALSVLAILPHFSFAVGFYPTLWVLINGAFWRFLASRSQILPSRADMIMVLYRTESEGSIKEPRFLREHIDTGGWGGNGGRILIGSREDLLQEMEEQLFTRIADTNGIPTFLEVLSRNVYTVQFCVAAAAIRNPEAATPIVPDEQRPPQADPDLDRLYALPSWMV